MCTQHRAFSPAEPSTAGLTLGKSPADCSPGPSSCRPARHPVPPMERERESRTETALQQTAPAGPRPTSQAREQSFLLQIKQGRQRGQNNLPQGRREPRCRRTASPQGHRPAPTAPPPHREGGPHPPSQRTERASLGAETCLVPRRVRTCEAPSLQLSGAVLSTAVATSHTRLSKLKISLFDCC